MSQTILWQNAFQRLCWYDHHFLLYYVYTSIVYLSLWNVRCFIGYFVPDVREFNGLILRVQISQKKHLGTVGTPVWQQPPYHTARLPRMSVPCTAVLNQATRKEICCAVERLLSRGCYHKTKYPTMQCQISQNLKLPPSQRYGGGAYLCESFKILDLGGFSYVCNYCVCSVIFILFPCPLF